MPLHFCTNSYAKRENLKVGTYWYPAPARRWNPGHAAPPTEVLTHAHSRSPVPDPKPEPEPDPDPDPEPEPP